MLLKSIQQYPNVQQIDYNMLAATGPMLDRVYSMRYRSYSSEGYINRNNSEKFIDSYDALPNCTSYLMYRNGKAMASIRACRYDPKENIPIPCMEIFKQELAQNIGLDVPFVEVNKFVVDPRFQRYGGKHARLMLFSSIVEETYKYNVQNVVIAVRPEHVNFYKMFYCKTISDVKAYPHLNFETVLMACTDVERARKLIMSRSKRLAQSKCGQFH
ncbi:N-acyl amino acid synthase FeeM domain-containing protein [Agarilytica rhodophyticola]|uniref:N-acyl amino acid synthase FeeM domain-containing protein n=1 Tax=Agarilytica rhodophyticola TaxID=1737490 RepID=UPI000B34602A|nr:hypothetical protein [Agarilytica rhodophyticola]